MTARVFDLVKSETVDLTRDLAVEFAKMPASMTERDLKKKRLDYLRDSVLGGNAITFNWARCRVIEDNITYRVNGHHSSTLLAALDGQMPTGLKVHIDDYEVETKPGLAHLFRQFDTRISARSVDDISGAYQGLYQALAGVSKKAGRSAIEGIVWYESRIVGVDMPAGDDKFALFNEDRYHAFILMMGRILSDKTPEFTRPVLGAMYGTYQNSPEQAEGFWIDVARQGGGNDERHPATVLDAWLLAGREADMKPKEIEVYRACALAWNAFRNNRSIERITRFDPKKGAPELE